MAFIAQGSEFLVNTNTIDYQFNSHISALPSGGFVATWTDRSYNMIRAQVFDPAGAKVGNEFQVDTFTNSYNSDVVGLTNGGFVITWNNSQSEYGLNTYAEIFDAYGARVSPAFLVTTGGRKS